VVEAGKQADRAQRALARGARASNFCAPQTPICTGSTSPRISTTPATGEIFAEAGDEITVKSLAPLLDAGASTELPILDIDHVNIGPYIRNTLTVDKNTSREDALFDIYRVMRPGEPPTVDTAEAMFNALFFDSERYDLSAVGRVKMNMRLDLDAPDTVRTLRKEDILSRCEGAVSTCATAAARSTTSTISATAGSARSAN
jgi:DNA-directed RNA polymerase subunit beta